MARFRLLELASVSLIEAVSAIDFIASVCPTDVGLRLCFRAAVDDSDIPNGGETWEATHEDVAEASRKTVRKRR